MIPGPGERVVLSHPAAGMPAGSEGVFIGWYFGEGEPQAIVSFWDGGPLRVPLALLTVGGPPGERAT